MKRASAKLKLVRKPQPKVEQLVDRYDPKTIDGLIGFEPIKAILKRFVQNPYKSAWFLLGPSGIGKTTLAMAIPPLIDGQPYHVPSRDCTLDRVEGIIHRTSMTPMQGKWHVVIVDEADQMSQPAQHAFLSVLDKTHMPEGAVFIFTANGTRGLEDRLLSRCRLLQFDAAQLDGPMKPYLASIWRKEGGSLKNPPDFVDVFRRSKRNVRTALMNLEMLLMDRNYQIPDPVETGTFVQGQLVNGGGKRRDGRPVDPAASERARRAWQTMRSPGWRPPQRGPQ